MSLNHGFDGREFMENKSQQPNYEEPFFQDPMFMEQEKHLSEYFFVLYQNRMLIGLFLAMSVLLMILITLNSTPLYSASAHLVVDDETIVSPITGQVTEYETYYSQDLAFQTHMKLITSTPVIEKVIEDLKLDRIDPDKPRVNPFRLLLSQLKKSILDKLKPAYGEPASELVDPETKRKNQLIAVIQGKINISEIRNTRLLIITVTDTDQKLATDIANSLALNYIHFNIATRAASAQENLQWLKAEMQNLKKQLEADEKAFYRFKMESNVFSMEGKQKIFDQKIEEFNNKYLEARNQRLVLGSTIKELEHLLENRKDIGSVRSLINNQLIDAINSKIVTLEIEHAKLTKIYKSKHPLVIEIEGELTKSKNRLEDALHKELISLKSEHSVLQAQENILGKTLEEFEQDALETSKKELIYTILQRNVDTSQNLYDSIVERIKETDISKTRGSSNIRVVEKANIPQSPISPNKKLNLLIGMALGVFGGCFLCFFLDYLDQTLKTDKQVKDQFKVPVVIMIPEADETEGYGNWE